ncbi:MAG: DUF4406 domain-containing protein [Flavobacteriaceae bacterium]|nr:DUF4406 domain-containing protein [Flavobacteriaceae bacterium]
MKIYITGKVTGEPIAECTMKFGMAQKQLEALGHQAINPLAVVNDFHTTWPEAMKLCIKALMDADAIYALPCHETSKGAFVELQLAAHLGVPIYHNLKHITL